MKPDTCHCCKPPTGGTPVTINNRPGLSAIAYRVGDFANFRQAMFQAISRSPELHRLSTRHSDDYAITIFELWAAIGDILTFYQERIAGEAFLRTAGLRDSVLRMAQMIGYELAPGSAATAFLNFTADKGKQVQVPVGLRVQSVPEQDEKPQKYETLEAITVYDWLNEQMIFPAPVGINPLAKGSMGAYLSAGEDGLLIAESLVEGDRILLSNLSASDSLEKITVRSIETDHEHLFVHFTQPIQKGTWDMETRAYKLGRAFRLFGYNAPPKYSEVELFDSGAIKLWKYIDTEYALSGTSRTKLNLDSRYDDLKVGARLLLVDGTNQQTLLTVTAVDQIQDQLGALSDTVTRVQVSPDFLQIDDRRHVVIHELTGPPISFWGFSYPDVIDSATVFIPGNRIDTETIEIARPIKKNTYQKGYTVKLTDIGIGRQVILKDDKNAPITAKISRIDITGNEVVFDATTDDAETISLLSLNRDSATSIEWSSDEDQTITISGIFSGKLDPVLDYTDLSPKISVRIGPVGPLTIELDSTKHTVEDIAADLKSKLNAADTSPFFKYASVLVSEQRLFIFSGIFETPPQDYLKIELSTDKSVAMDRSSARLLGNVASASHGETIASEILGDADPAIPFQKFTLKKSPVTYVPSSAEGGVDNTLQLFINDILWEEVDTLFGKTQKDTAYTARINNDAEMSVRFGDGVTGARPPKGRANVIARYRQGLGLDGRVKAGALKTLLDKPKGLKSVLNPAGADGGADPETLDNARKNAPTTVRTFDRAVSLLDLEDLARSRSEVAKAKVTWVWNGDSQLAHLTIAGQEGGIFSSSALSRIHAGLTAQRDPNRRLLMDNYQPIPILVTATLNINATYVAAKVADDARSTILAALSFDALEFAQAIHLSDVYAVLQNISGVAAVDIDLLMFKQNANVTDVAFAGFLNDRGIRRLADDTPDPLQHHLWILPARPNTTSNDPAVLPAEQASIESPSQDVTIITKGGLPGQV